MSTSPIFLIQKRDEPLDRTIRLLSCNTKAVRLLDRASIEHGQACLQASGSTGRTLKRWLILSALSVVGSHVYRACSPNGKASQCVNYSSTTTGTIQPCTVENTGIRSATQIISGVVVWGPDVCPTEAFRGRKKVQRSMRPMVMGLMPGHRANSSFLDRLLWSDFTWKRERCLHLERTIHSPAVSSCRS